MAEVKRDDPFEAELTGYKRRLLVTETVFRSLTNCFRELSPQDRAGQIQQIQQNFRAIFRFIEGVKMSQIHNVGLKFSFDNFKQSYFLVLGRWRKFERTL